MNVEVAYQSVLAELKRYVEARSTKRKDDAGRVWESGVTIVSAEDKRLEEMARLAVEAITRSDDGKPLRSVEARKLMPGDVFTRYTITTDGVAVDEEVTVVQRTGTTSSPRIKFRNEQGTYAEIEMPGHYLLSVYRATVDDLRKELADG
jgi:hypothetical protein